MTRIVSALEERGLVTRTADPADRRLAQAIELARTVIGFPRHLSQHVGGFVLSLIHI